MLSGYLISIALVSFFTLLEFFLFFIVDVVEIIQKLNEITYLFKLVFKRPKFIKDVYYFCFKPSQSNTCMQKVDFFIF